MRSFDGPTLDPEVSVTPTVDGEQDAPSHPTGRTPLRLIDSDELAKMVRFSYDPSGREARRSLPALGDRLSKTGALLAGTSVLYRPKYQARVLVFAKDALVAEGDMDDPWHLVAVDREAFFTVADVYDHGDVTQVTLVEIGGTDLLSDDPVLLDDEARAAVRNLLIGSYAVDPPSYANEEYYKKAMGNPKEGGAPKRFYPFMDTFATNQRDGHVPPPAQPTLPLDDARFVKAFSVADPRDPDAAYELLLERALLARTKNDPIQYRTYQVAHVRDGRMRIMAKMQTNSFYVTQGFVPGWVGDARHALLKVTNKGKLASGNINVARSGDKYDRAASWVRDTNGNFVITYKGQPADGSARPVSVFGSYEELGLFAFAYLGVPALEGQKAYEHDRLAEVHLEAVPANKTIEDATGRCVYVRAAHRQDDGRPSLAYLEAQENHRRMCARTTARSEIGALYEGRINPITLAGRDLLDDKVWYDPLTGNWSYPLSVMDAQQYMADLRADYEQKRVKDPAGVIPLDVFESRLAAIRDSAEGNIDECLRGMTSDFSRVFLPYRYEFSCAIDKESQDACINLFLPQQAVFPSTAANMDKLGSSVDYHTLDLSQRQINEHYLDVVSRLVLLTLCMVKNNAPWVTKLRLDAWYRTDAGPECRCALAVGESDLKGYKTENPEYSLTILKELGASMHIDKEKALLGVKPLVSLEDALDYRFGFERMRGGWTIPYGVSEPPSIPSERDLRWKLGRIMRESMQVGSEPALGDAHDLEETYVQAWIDRSVPSDVVQLSCDNAFQLEFSKRLCEGRSFVELPRGLIDLYHVIGDLESNLGNVTEAREAYEKASAFAPAAPGPLMALAAWGINENDLDMARDALMRADQVACLAEDRRILSDVLDSLVKCGGDEGTVLSGPSLEAIAVATPVIDAALQGGPYPPDDGSYQDVYEALAPKESLAAPAWQELCLETRGDRLGSASLTAYLLKPILLTNYVMLEMLDAECGLVTDEDDEATLALMAIPYVDERTGLLFLEAIASLDAETREVRHVCPWERHYGVAGDSLKREHFVALRPQDYPSLSLDKRCAELAMMHADTPEREATRALKELDQLRSFENPDSVLVVLEGRDASDAPLDAEGVWAHLECLDEGGNVHATIQDEPVDDFGIHQGARCRLQIRTDVTSGHPMAFVEGLTEDQA